jgi:hypothetical protein
MLKTHRLQLFTTMTIATDNVPPSNDENKDSWRGGILGQSVAIEFIVGDMDNTSEYNYA